jgi:hypothetical protein
MHPNPSAYTRATPRAIRTAKPSRYARVYSGTSPNPVIAERPAFHRNALQQLADERFLLFQFRD